MSGEVVGVVAKPESGLAEDAAWRVVSKLLEMGVSVAIEVDTLKSYPRFQGFPSFDLSRDPPDRIVVVGGDGTLLRTLQRLGDASPLIMTVRAGKRGFLLDVEPYEIEDRVRDFVEGKYKVYEYHRLEPSIGGRGLPCALNDVVFITKMAKLVKLAVYAEGERIYNIDGDGVVVSTTVGSTAYSLSAGGPIIDPSLDVVVIAPLNPVQLHLRPVVLPADYRVEVEVRPGSGDLYMSVDGQYVEELEPGVVVAMKRCRTPARIARFKWWENYYERLFSRLLAYW